MQSAPAENPGDSLRLWLPESVPLPGSFRPVDADAEELPALFLLGQLDAALVYGEVARDLLGRDGLAGVTLSPAPGWDRTYFLWCGDGAARRWTRDPSFRAWLSATVDRESLVAHALSGEGAPAFGLVSAGSPGSFGGTTGWKVPGGLVPRLVLAYSGGDEISRRLADALRREMERREIELDPEPVPPDRLLGLVADGSVQLALLSHVPTTSDDVAALQETFAALGTRAEKPRADLALADLERDPDRRRSLALRAQELLFDDPEEPRDAFVMIPLVRAHAFLATTTPWSNSPMVRALLRRSDDAASP